MWQAFLLSTKNPVPPNYGEIFPQVLIESLGQSVIKGCQKIDLRSYPEQLRKFDLPISKILNEAWTEVLANSPNYKDWEEQKITAIGTII